MSASANRAKALQSAKTAQGGAENCATSQDFS